MTTAQPVRDVMPAFDGAQISARRGRAGLGGEREEGRRRSSQYQAERVTSRQLWISAGRNVSKESDQREMCVSHIHTHLLGFSAGKGTCQTLLSQTHL